MANVETASPALINSDEVQNFFAGTWPKFWLLLMCSGLPMMYPYFAELWHFERYRYFPLVLLAVGFLVYTRSDGRMYAPKSWISWCAIGSGLFSILLAALTQYPWFAAVGLVTIATCCLSAMRGPHDRSLLGIAVTLWMLVKLPFRMDNTFVQELQSITTRLSSVFLDFLAVPHAATGNVLRLADRELFVAEACSGVQSVFTLAFVACFLISAFRLRIWMFPIYLAVAVFLAVAANIMRVTSIAVAAAWYELDLSTGWAHEAVGYLCLAIAIGFLLSFDRFAVVLFHDMGDHDDDGNPFMRIWNWLSIHNLDDLDDEDDPSLVDATNKMSCSAVTTRLSGISAIRWSFIGIVGLVSLLSAVQIFNSQRRRVAISKDAVLFEPDPDVLKGTYGFLTVTGHEMERGGKNARLGKNADIWNCVASDESLTAQVVLSQSYSGWKELCVCYEGRSWDLVDRSIERRPRGESPSDQTHDVSYAVGRFRGKSGENAYLLFSALRPDGTVMPALSRFGALGNRFVHRFDHSGVWELEDVMMLQMWVVTNDKLTPRVVNKLESDFVKFRSMIAKSARGEPTELQQSQAEIETNQSVADNNATPAASTAQAGEAK